MLTTSGDANIGINKVPFHYFMLVTHTHTQKGSKRMDRKHIENASLGYDEWAIDNIQNVPLTTSERRSAAPIAVETRTDSETISQYSDSDDGLGPQPGALFLTDVQEHPMPEYSTLHLVANMVPSVFNSVVRICGVGRPFNATDAIAYHQNTYRGLASMIMGWKLGRAVRRGQVRVEFAVSEYVANHHTTGNDQKHHLPGTGTSQHAHPVVHGRMDEDQLQCKICLSEFVNGDEITRLTCCNRPMHTSCFRPWTQPTCPFCRSRIRDG